MTCIQCGAELETREFSGVRIEVCPACGGSWFDRGELQEAEGNADPDLAWKEFSLWSDAEALKASGEPESCPSCGGRLSHIAYGDTGVKVGYCVDCQGVWLSRGGFRKIIQAMESDIDSTTASEYLRESLREAREVIEAGDNFEEEWRQFRTVLRLLQYRFLAEHTKLARIVENFTTPFA